MVINLKEVIDKNIRNNFVIDNLEFYSFLNSWERGELQKLEGNEIFRLGIFEEENQVGQIMLIKITAKRGSFFLAPHSPLIKENYFEVLKKAIPEIKKLAKNLNVSFLRICPQIENNKNNLKNIKDIGFKFSPIHMHAEETHILDLKLSEEILMQNMRKTTRYMINRSYKEGVKVYEDNSPDNIDKFIELHHKHAKRTNGKLNYNAFSKKYIHNLFKVFDKSQIWCLNAEYNGFIEASLVNIRFGKSCVYYLGASDIKNPKFSPAYVLQREAIKKAQGLGCTSYNFRGVSPDDNPKHPLAGVSLFKRGFGGYDFNLLHAHDYAFNIKYFLTFAIERFRAKKRGYYYPLPKN